MKKLAIIMLMGLTAYTFIPIKSHSLELGDSVAIGDSLTAGLARIPGVGLVCAAQNNRVVSAADQRSCKGNGKDGVGGWPRFLKSLSDQRVFNYGNSGERTVEMVNRLPSHLNQRSSEFVLILAGTNDMIFGDSTKSTINNISNLVQISLNANRTPIVATLPPLIGGSRNAVNPRIVQLNQQIRQLPKQFKGLVIAELYNPLIVGWPNRFSADTVHFNTAGNTLVANIWLKAMQSSKRKGVNALPAIYSLLLDDD